MTEKSSSQEESAPKAKTYTSFKEFYPFYLSEHKNPVNRFLHFCGTGCGLGLLVTAVLTQNWLFVPLALVIGYAFAWFGHFLIEKNRPATFTYPFYSFMGDWVMFFQLLTFQRKFKE